MIGTAIAAYFVFTDDLDSLKKPFLEALKQYDDTSNNQADKTLVRAWDSFQQDVSYFLKLYKKNLMCGSCHFDMALNDKFRVEFGMFDLVVS